MACDASGNLVREGSPYWHMRALAKEKLNTLVGFVQDMDLSIIHQKCHSVLHKKLDHPNEPVQKEETMGEVLPIMSEA